MKLKHAGALAEMRAEVSLRLKSLKSQAVIFSIGKCFENIDLDVFKFFYCFQIHQIVELPGKNCEDNICTKILYSFKFIKPLKSFEFKEEENFHGSKVLNLVSS